MKTLPIPNDIGDYIAIDDSLPCGLVWIKQSSRYGKKVVGKPAGTLKHGGYYLVGFRGIKYRCHRVIHFLTTGEDPGDKDIDHHKDQSNTVTNLRPATHQQNSFNMRPHRHSFSKYKGVCWDKEKNKWLARIILNGKQKKLGYYHNEEDAAYAYNIAAPIVFGEYARLNELPKEYNINLFQYKDKVIKKANELLATI